MVVKKTFNEIGFQDFPLYNANEEVGTSLRCESSMIIAEKAVMIPTASTE